MKKILLMIGTVAILLTGCGSSGGDSGNPVADAVTQPTIETHGFTYFLKGAKKWICYNMDGTILEEQTLYPSGERKHIIAYENSKVYSKHTNYETFYYGSSYSNTQNVQYFDKITGNLSSERTYEVKDNILVKTTYRDINTGNTTITNYTVITNSDYLLKLGDSDGNTYEYHFGENKKLIKRVTNFNNSSTPKTYYYDDLKRLIKNDDTIYVNYQGNILYCDLINGKMSIKHIYNIENNKLVSHSRHQLNNNGEFVKDVYSVVQY